VTATLIDSDAVTFADGNGGHSYTFPAGAPNSGELDVLCINSNTTVSTPSGFTLKVDATNNQGAYIYIRVASGGESSSVTITTSGNHKTDLVWSRWSSQTAFDVGTFARADGVSDSTTPSVSTGTLAGTNELVIAFGALHNFATTPPTSPSWSSGYTVLESTSLGNSGDSDGVAAFVGYRLDAGTASESPNVSWTNNCRNRYMLVLTYTTAAGVTDKSGSDSGTLTDTSSLAAALSASDTGTLTDTSSLTAAITPTDTATLADTSSLTAAATATDTATVTDSSSLLASLTSSDSATFSEGAAAVVIVAAGSDSAVFTDTATLTVTISTSDNFVFTDSSQSRSFTLTTPTVDEGIWTNDRLFSRYRIARGVTLLVSGSTVTAVQYPEQEDLDGYDHVYLGGHVYTLTPEEATILIAAGYGAYIT